MNGSDPSKSETMMKWYYWNCFKETGCDGVYWIELHWSWL